MSDNPEGEQPQPPEIPNHVADISEQTIQMLNTDYETSEAWEIIQKATKSNTDNVLEQLAEVNPDFVKLVGEVFRNASGMSSGILKEYAYGFTAIIRAYDFQSKGALIEGIKNFSPEEMLRQKESWSEVVQEASIEDPFEKALRAPKIPNSYMRLNDFTSKIAVSFSKVYGAHTHNNIKRGAVTAFEIIRRNSLPTEPKE